MPSFPTCSRSRAGFGSDGERRARLSRRAWPSSARKCDRRWARNISPGPGLAGRRTGRPFFIDKTPNNWAHVGLIQLILPNAKIVDVRRHPLGCCLSNFKQYFAEGQEFSYSLTDLGRYYRDYVRLMRHFDEALPGRIHRVIYEQLVEDMEGRGKPAARPRWASNSTRRAAFP